MSTPSAFLLVTNMKLQSPLVVLAFYLPIVVPRVRRPEKRDSRTSGRSRQPVEGSHRLPRYERAHQAPVRLTEKGCRPRNKTQWSAHQADRAKQLTSVSPRSGRHPVAHGDSHGRGNIQDKSRSPVRGDISPSAYPPAAHVLLRGGEGWVH